MFETIYPHIWMALPKESREHLVTVFNIPRTGISEIKDQELISDGHSLEDLKAITLEKMCTYIGSTETFPRAWEITCAKVKFELNPPPIDLDSLKEEPVPVISQSPVEEIEKALETPTITTTSHGKEKKSK